MTTAKKPVRRRKAEMAAAVVQAAAELPAGDVAQAAAELPAGDVATSAALPARAVPADLVPVGPVYYALHESQASQTPELARRSWNEERVQRLHEQLIVAKDRVESARAGITQALAFFERCRQLADKLQLRLNRARRKAAEDEGAE